MYKSMEETLLQLHRVVAVIDALVPREQQRLIFSEDESGAGLCRGNIQYSDDGIDVVFYDHTNVEAGFEKTWHVFIYGKEEKLNMLKEMLNGRRVAE